MRLISVLICRVSLGWSTDLILNEFRVPKVMNDFLLLLYIYKVTYISSSTCHILIYPYSIIYEKANNVRGQAQPPPPPIEYGLFLEKK